MYDTYQNNLAVKSKMHGARCRFGSKTLATLMLFVSILVCWPGWSVSYAGVNGETAYLLNSGDTIRIKVHEWPGFDGDISVAADGTIGIPIIGSLNAKGLQVRKLADLIAERLRRSSNLAIPPSVVVSIVKYRPFFILGDVERPGEYEFRPGLTVLKAVSIAGGYFRVRDTSFVRNSIIARSDLRTNTRRIHRALVRLARIKAEIEGAETFEIPAELASLARDPGLRKLIGKERAILTANLDLSRQKIETSEGLSKISEQAIESLQKELDSTTKQFEIVEKEAKRVRHLASRGLTNAERVTGVELTLSRVETARQALQTLIIRTRLTLYREQRRADELKTEAAKELHDEQQITLTALKEARVLQRRSEELIIEAEESTPKDFKVSREEKMLRKFAIVRRIGDETKKIEIQALAEVKPGDVIKVEKIIPTSTNKTSQLSPLSHYGADRSAAERQ